jgi:RimJ/RimL family protein N-acetyltransferase
MSGTPRETGLPVYRVVSDGAAIAGVAVRTGLGRALVCSDMPDAAVEALWRDVAALDPQKGPIDQLNGPDRVVDRLMALSGRPWRLLMHLGSYSTRGVVPPRACPGALRLARPDEADLLVAWNREFALEAMGLSVGADKPDIERRIAQGVLYLWDDGGPVCQTYSAAPTVNGVRVTGVYTPKAHRGKGYASSLVAGVAQRLLDAGNRVVYLFTDMVNPTSNAIYLRIGFRRFATMKHVGLPRD